MKIAKRQFAKVFSVAILFITIRHSGISQISEFVYGISYVTNSVFYFSKVDLVTGTKTDLSPLSSAFIATNGSSCVDYLNNIYYLCTGASLIGIEPASGSVVSNVVLPIPPTSALLYSAFNSCDTSIYGVIKDNSSAISFGSYKPSTGEMTIISPLSIPNIFALGAKSIIDPVNEIFFFDQGGLLRGIDMASGDIVINSQIINLPDESFGHYAYERNTNQIYGTSANLAISAKFLATIDPVTGIVTHVAESNWTSGFFKPSNGGSCIDQQAGVFYYSGAGNLVNGVMITTGELIFSHTLGTGTEFFFVEHISGAECTETSINIATVLSGGLKISPNPVSDKLILEIAQLVEYIVIRNLLGEVSIEKSSNQNELDVSTLPAGVYIVSVVGGDYRQSKMFVKN